MSAGRLLKSKVRVQEPHLSCVWLLSEPSHSEGLPPAEDSLVGTHRSLRLTALLELLNAGGTLRLWALTLRHAVLHRYWNEDGRQHARAGLSVHGDACTAPPHRG